MKETWFSLNLFQTWHRHTAGSLRVQQETVAGGHGWQGAGKDLYFSLFLSFTLSLSYNILCYCFPDLQSSNYTEQEGRK